MAIKQNHIPYFISAGELSGDLLASDVVHYLKQIQPHLKPFGMTGPSMREAGVESIFEQETIAVMGFYEVLKSLETIIACEKKILQSVDQKKPVFALLVDYPGLHFRIAEQLKIRQIPVYQYSAPKVWAWGKHRIKNLNRDFKKIFGILPFETNFFKKFETPYEYVGTPILDRVKKINVTRKFLNFSEQDLIISVIPGSRKSEILYNLPICFQIINHVAHKFPQAVFVIPCAQGLDRNWLEKYSQEFNVQKNKVIFYSGMAIELMRISDAAMVASGTATLECALAKTPQIVIYRLSPITHMLASQLVHLPFVSLVNLIADEKIVEEYIQDFSSLEAAEELISLIEDKSKRNKMLMAYEKVENSLIENASFHVAKKITDDLK